MRDIERVRSRRWGPIGFSSRTIPAQGTPGGGKKGGTSPGGKGGKGGGGGGTIPGGGGGGGATVTWNPSDKDADITLSVGNLVATINSGLDGKVRATQGRTVGANSNVYQFEVLSGGSGSTYPMIGIATSASVLTAATGNDANSWAYAGFGGYIRNNNAYVGSAITAYGYLDVVGITLNLSTGAMLVYKNGVLTVAAGAPTGLTGEWFPSVGGWSPNAAAAIYTANFGATAFTYPIGGALAWNAA